MYNQTLYCGYYGVTKSKNYTGRVLVYCLHKNFKVSAGSLILPLWGLTSLIWIIVTHVWSFMATFDVNFELLSCCYATLREIGGLGTVRLSNFGYEVIDRTFLPKRICLCKLGIFILSLWQFTIPWFVSQVYCFLHNRHLKFLIFAVISIRV